MSEIKFKNLGSILVDVGDVVSFSFDSCMDIAEKLNMDVHKFIRTFSGVECDFRADGCYDVNKVAAVQNNGDTYDMVLIGGDIENFRRFLNDGEEEFSDFFKSHPRKSELGSGDNYNQDLFDQILEEYKQRLLNKSA